MERIFVGIDTGLDGAIAALDAQGKFLRVVDTPYLEIISGTKKKPKTRRKYNTAQLCKVIIELCEDKDPVIMIELVGAMPDQDASSGFRQGKGCGIWEGALTMFMLGTNAGTFSEVSPQRWKKMMLPDLNKASKNSSLHRAQQLFPAADLSLKKYDGRAEALLIAEYGRRLYNNPPHETIGSDKKS